MARVWSEESKLETWLRVELAALDAWAEVGVVPEADVRAIRERAVTPSPERVAEIERVTDHDTAAFVDAVAELLGPEGRWIHYGLTSSDVVDTALALQIQDAGRLLLEAIDAALAVVVRRAEEHRRTVTIGRSHGVHAEPTTFGWKLAGWAFELDRGRTRLARGLEVTRVGQLSGTVGTYAHVEPEVERLACEALGLEPDPLSTQVIARDRHAELLSALARDASHGLVFSHRLLLALVDAGLGRDEAYRLVQRHATQAWEDELDFHELVAADPEIAGRLGRESLAGVFDLDASIRHVDVVFERLRALAGKKEAVHV